jgi:LPS export ABC transporter permease LptF
MTIFRTIILELISPFTLTLLVMTSLMMMEKVYRLVSLVVDNRLKSWEVVLMLVYRLPEVFTVTLPLAVVGAVFIVIIRQSMDSEVISLRVTGRSIWSYALPFIVFGLLIGLIAALMSLWLQPLGSRKYDQLQVEMVRSRAEHKLIPGQFNYDFGDKVIYVGGRISENELSDIFISNRVLGPTSSIISANSGLIEVDNATQQVIFRLKDGEIYTPEHNAESFRILAFDTLRYVLEFEPVRTIKLSRKASMTTRELIQGVKDSKPGSSTYVALSLELVGRLTVPWSCLAFALAAIPMAVIDPRSGQSAGYLRAIFLVTSYYIVWSGFRDLVYGGHAEATALLLPSGLIILYGMVRLWQLNSDIDSLWQAFRNAIRPT